MNIILRFTFVLAGLVALFPVHAQVAPDSVPDLQLQAPNGSGGFVPATVYATLRQADGKLLVGGNFTRLANGTPRNRLLRLNADGSLDAGFAPNFQSGTTTCQIQSLALANGYIYAGGAFDTVNGTASPNVARIDSSGALAAGWNSPFAAGSPGQAIRALAATSTSLFIGGDIQLNDAFGLARLDALTGNWDHAWIAQTQDGDLANPPTGGTRGAVRALLAVDGDLLVAGQFQKIANVLVRGVARLSQSAPVSVRAFDAGLSASSYRVSVMRRSGTKLYIGGTFFRAQAPFVNYLNRVDLATGALDAGWQPNPNGNVEALALDGNLLYVGGDFTNVIAPNGGNRLIRIPTNGNGAVDAAWNTSMNGTVFSLVHDCRLRVVAGGAFDSAGGLARNGLAGYLSPTADCLFQSGFEAP